MMSDPCRILYWGLVGFEEAVRRQKELLDGVSRGGSHALILCEHPAVITLGRTSHEENLFRSREDLQARGIDVRVVDRGGDVTLHAPGQLVLYPVVDLKRAGRDIRGYLRKLEQVAVDLLREFDILARGDDGRRGIWCADEKIASIGVGLSRWTTYHGMALNVNTDLELFRLIRPCGLDVRMTSMQKIKGCSFEMMDVVREAERHFLNVFGFTKV